MQNYKTYHTEEEENRSKFFKIINKIHSDDEIEFGDSYVKVNLVESYEEDNSNVNNKSSNYDMGCYSRDDVKKIKEEDQIIEKFEYFISLNFINLHKNIKK